MVIIDPTITICQRHSSTLLNCRVRYFIPKRVQVEDSNPTIEVELKPYCPGDGPCRNVAPFLCLIKCRTVLNSVVTYLINVSVTEIVFILFKGYRGLFNSIMADGTFAIREKWGNSTRLRRPAAHKCLQGFLSNTLPCTLGSQ